MLTYENPIIPGFYPDPSVCRVGEDYYLVNSSFEFFPGVPLWHSRDLLHWEQIGYVLTRESQLPLNKARTSGGIFAPTIRYHDGRFYMITTNVTDGGNFFVWTDDIRGEWSDPVYIDQQGIDPSLFWDDDGTVYYTGTHTDENGESCIGMFPVDLETGARLSETKAIWYGTGGKCPEGPHLYKINGWYYLMIAEGGTEYGHMETIARSRSVWGPYESCPHNPILTHRNTNGAAFQGTGHADLVEDPDGKWWLVFHAIRPSMFMLHHIGRETMLAPVTWDENGWPVVYDGRIIESPMQTEGEGDVRPERNWQDDFSAGEPAPRWSWLRNPDRTRYAFGGGLMLHGAEDTLNDIGAPTFLGVRQQQFALRYETDMRISGGAGRAGLTVFHTAEHHYDLYVQKRESGCTVQLYRRAADMEMRTEPAAFAGTDTLLLRIDADRSRYTFYAGEDEAHLVKIGTGSTQLLSTE
ncbi:MAG: glycoside hydrolase family 43 protein [Hominenteromicrobium sp.]